MQGCDGSILLEISNGMTAETLSDKNLGIQKLDVINEIKNSLEIICPETVSCADIIQLSERDALHLVSYIGFLKIKEAKKKLHELLSVFFMLKKLFFLSSLKGHKYQF